MSLDRKEIVIWWTKSKEEKIFTLAVVANIHILIVDKSFLNTRQ